MRLVDNTIGKIDRFQQRHRLLAFPYAVVKKYGEDGAGYHAALLTYYGFLSLFPLLLLVTTVADTMAGSNPELENTLITSITDYFPVLGNQLSNNVDRLSGSGLALIAGLLFVLYGTRGVADVFCRGVRQIWGEADAKPTPFPKSVIKSISIVVTGGVGFILASALTGLAASSGLGWPFSILSVFVNLVILVGLFHLLINLSLPKKVSFKDTQNGAIVAALGLLLLQVVGGYVLSRELKNLDALYSYFAVSLGLLFWIYLQAQVVYYAIETSVVSTKKLWPRSLQEPAAKD